MSENSSRVSPVVAIAATSVTLFSLVGIGVLTGIIPSSYSKDDEQQPAQAVTAPAPAHKSVHRAPPAKAAEHTRVASAEPVRAPSRAVCASCGTVASINVIEHKGESTGLGAVAGGVLGGVLGNSVGGGDGRKIATVAGIAGGALAGNEVEKRVKTERSYDVAVRMDDGAVRHFGYNAQPSFRPGDQVRVVDGKLVD